ncbi:MAG: TonB-dependent receptor plug domain-containing protein [Alistipes sp.]|nr:TonB-dependent receptor plug domain-containing protein [Alistipes sp.]
MNLRTFLSALLPIIFTAYMPLQANADNPESEGYRLAVQLLNKKGAPYKGGGGLTVSIDSTGEALPVPGNGLLYFDGVMPEDTLNIISKTTFFQIPVSGLDSVNVILKNPRRIEGFYRSHMDETVDYGYYVVSKKNNTYPSNTVNMEGAENYRNLLEFLRGRVPGVQVEGNRLVIRGTGTINSSTDPLVVVDGVPVDFQSANQTIHPRDIESISVDKVGSMYGVRGANGVIIIQTQRGQ